MKLRVKVQETRPKNIDDGDNGRTMVQPDMNLVGRRQSVGAVAVRKRPAVEKRR
jgi:hypothetical protein